LEWGETLRQAAARELVEETGAEVLSLGRLLGVYSAPERDFRFHAVTVVVEARVTAPSATPNNPLEVREVRLFDEHELPEQLSHGTLDMLHNALRSELTWE
jgi:8-oxo-dGTP diphosphatase